jgi:hypothetical protein
MAAARLLNQDSVMPINQMAKVLRRPVYLCPPHGTLNHRFGAYVGELVFENQLTGLTEELELRQFNTEVSYFDLVYLWNVTGIKEVPVRIGTVILDAIMCHGGLIAVILAQRACELPQTGIFDDVLKSAIVASPQSLFLYKYAKLRTELYQRILTANKKYACFKFDWLDRASLITQRSQHIGG